MSVLFIGSPGLSAVCGTRQVRDRYVLIDSTASCTACLWDLGKHGEDVGKRKTAESGGAALVSILNHFSQLITISVAL